MEQKEALRSRLLVWRRALSDEKRTLWSRQITDRVLSWPRYQESQTIHCYRSMASMGEVETSPLIQQMRADGKRVVIPRTEASGMVSVVLDESTRWRQHPLGMLEPEEGEVVPCDEIDLVLVPLLAADRNGNRLGYGKGMYDRFLSSVDGVKAGLLYSRLVQSSPIPVEPHDVPLEWIVTEETIIRCSFDKDVRS